MTRIPIPPPTQPAVDSETGQWTQPWYQYFSQPDFTIVSSYATATQAPKGFFRVDLNSTNQTVSPLSTTQILNFNHEVVDTSSWYDSTTFKYTPQEPGYYQFTAQVYVPLTTAGVTAEPYILKNSTIEFFGTYVSRQSTSADSATNVVGMLFMNGTTDNVQFGVYNPSATVSGITNLTYAFGYKIGST